MTLPTECRDDLNVALESAWQMLEMAVSDRHAAFHIPVLATVTADGAPSARIVVLRGASAAEWRLRCHTDNRSSKFAEISAQPSVMFHFYDPVHKVQVRASGTADLHGGDQTALAAWKGSASSSRECYFAEPGPGTAIELPTNGLPDDPSAFENEERGLSAFTVVNASITRMEWVHLDYRGHRRAVFDRTTAGIKMSWLVP